MSDQGALAYTEDNSAMCANTMEKQACIAQDGF